MANVKINTRGPIFDRARREGLLKAGIREGTEKLLPRVHAAVVGKLDSSLKNPTGRYRRTIQAKTFESGVGVVNSSDTRKLKTWLETGRRSGVKTKRKGAYAWRAGKALAKSENKAGYYEAVIARRLNG